MNKFDKKIVITASVLAAVTIAIGALGAHALEQRISVKALAAFETGVRYQMYHVLALLMLGLATTIPIGVRKWTSWFFIFGIVFFSGSIYLLSLNSILTIDTKFLGPLTPIGGFCFILGWLRLAFGVFKLK